MRIHDVQVTAGVHANGSYIFAQLFAMGRAAKPELLEAQGLPYVAPSPITMAGRDRPPREMTKAEIEGLVEDYTQAAKNAIEAGFDGVELHS